ncbi:sulfotransferase family protein [Spirillospora sp. CA-294931]|uniref:sulfotransferase family protein n=1 Tax=Spirillospora sp. CA-294931 TaxID=3240042 RepID=UPI003D8E1CF4
MNPVCESPVFVLSTARSGSTLLRFILDSHPVLACPPESDVALAGRHLFRTARILDQARPGGPEQSPPDGGLPPHLAAAVRTPIDAIFGQFLRDTGKSRWCDKSPDSAADAHLLADLYPEAKFICLYRHCMDVVASLLESHPFGLGGGLAARHQSFTAQYPGNLVAAAGAYWESHVDRMTAFEEKNPERCHRVRYEDLVTAPEETAEGIFSFLDVEQVPGITQACFQVEHARVGPGDKKIWLTDRVSSDSLGRGVRIPAGFLPRPLRDEVNGLLGKLDYRPVDRSWNEAVDHTDPRTEPPAPKGGSPELDAAVREVDDRVTSLSPGDLQLIVERWPALAGQALRIIVQGPDGASRKLDWSFAPAGEKIALRPEPAADGEPITLAADAATWRGLIAGTANLEIERKAGRLRHFQRRDGFPGSDSHWNELLAASTLLGFAPVPAVSADA